MLCLKARGTCKPVHVVVVDNLLDPIFDVQSM